VTQDAPTTSPPANHVVIQPHRGWIGIDWAELARYRELLAFLVWRDIKVKYKQAALGLAWSVIVPTISLCIYGGVASVFQFGQYLAEPRPPIILWMFAGLLPWLFIQRAINDGGMSLLNNQPLMTKIYLPRLYLPLSACGNALVDMAINALLITAVGLYFLFIAALGIAFTLSAATVLYRDLRFLIPFFVQFGLWLSAVPYPLNAFSEKWKMLFAVNPLTGIVAGFRSAITGQPWEWIPLISSVVLSFGLLLFGLFYFKKVERLFADIA
jgi:lipopolysaccharide transport system permease protein